MKTGEFKILREYQDEAVMSCSKSISVGNKYTAIVSPTGSGKSLMMSAVAARVRDLNKISGGVICAPFISIENSFLKGDRSTSNLEDLRIKRFLSSDKVQGLSSDNIIADVNSRDIFYDYRNNGDDASDAVIGMFSKFVVTTNQQLTKKEWMKAFFDKTIEQYGDLSGKLLIIDEAHHVTIEEKNSLGAFTEQWANMNGQVLMVTATPYRLDGKSVIPEDAYVFSRTIAEHSSSGYAPNNFEIGVVSSGVKSENVEQFYGEEPCDDYLAAITSMVLAWENDGKPKAVMNVPAGNSSDWASEIKRLIGDRHPECNVVNAVGDENKKKFVEILKNESYAKRYEDSKVDIFVACKRFEEGTDWKFCSHVYNWGVPKSFGLIVQRWGRSFRDKRGIANYPEKFENEASIKFFVTKIDEDKLDKKHREHVWLISAFLYDWETAKNISHVYKSSFKSAIREVVFETTQDNSAHKEEDLKFDVNKIISSIYVNDLDKSKVLNIIASIENTISYSKGDCTVGDVAKYIDSVDDDLLSSSKDDILNILTEHAISGSKDSELAKENIKEAVRYEIIKSNYPSSSIDINFREIYLKIIEKYSDLTVDLYDGIVSKCSRFTGEDVAEITNRLKESYEIFKKVNPDVVKAWIEKYHKKHKSLPSNSSTESSKEFSGLDATWSTVSDRLKSVSGKNFFDLGKELGIVKEISLESIKTLCDEFKDFSGEHPSINSGFAKAGIDYFMIDSAKGENRLISTFNSVHKWLSKNGYVSLNSFLELPTNTVAEYTEKDVAAWIFDYMSNNGFSSLPKNKDVCDYSGRGSTWLAVEKKIKKSIFTIAACNNIVDTLTLSDMKNLHDKYYFGNRSDKGDGKLYALDTNKGLKRFLFSNINNLYRVAKTHYNVGLDHFNPNARTVGQVTASDIENAIKSYFHSNSALPASEDSSCSEKYSGHKKSWSALSQICKKLCDGKNFIEIAEKLDIVKLIDRNNVISFVERWIELHNGKVPSVSTKIGMFEGRLYAIKNCNGKVKDVIGSFNSINSLLKKSHGKQISELFRESSNLAFDFSEDQLREAVCSYYDGLIDPNTRYKIPGKNTGDASEYFGGEKKAWAYFYNKNLEKNPNRSFANILYDAKKISVVNSKTLFDIIYSFKNCNGKLPGGKDKLIRKNHYYMEDESSGKISTIPINTFQSIIKNISKFGYESISDFAVKNNI